MVKNTLVAAGLCCFALVSNGQSAKEMLKEIEGQYELDDIGNVTYTRVVAFDSMKKDEIYSRALAYFVYAYNSGKAVIQTQDKEAGTIIGKGIYPRVHTGMDFTTSVFDTEHILRIDVKEGKARILVTLVQYNITTITGQYGQRSYSDFPVGALAPFTTKMKTMGSKAFAKSHEKVQKTFSELERAIRDGNTGKEGKNDW